MKKIVFLSLIFGLSAFYLQAQVTVGLGEEPEKGALMQLKNKENVQDDSYNATKGLGLPRVELTQAGQLFPMFLKDPADPASGPTDEYSASKVSLDKKHKGLMVYNTSSVFAQGIYYWDGEKWMAVREDTTNAVFEITNCGAISFTGAYYNNVALNYGNVLSLKVDVDEPGYYNLLAQPEPDNGYYFMASGEFRTKGEFEVFLTGAGTPIAVTPTGGQGDQIFIFSNGKKYETSPGNYCSQYLKISDSSHRPKYAISCNSIVVNGVYKKGSVLNNSHTITMRLNVYAESQGATYSVHTETIDGISFSGEGVLGAAGTQDITLYGEGTPENTSDKLFTIVTNSESTSATCHALVEPVIAQKRIMAAGDLLYGLTSGGDNGCGAMIRSNMNYGDHPNSIVKYEGFTDVHTSTGLWSLSSWVSGSNPYDIIVITYNLTPDASQRAMLVQYVNKGGVLIYLDQNVSSSNTQMVGDIFGESISSPVGIGYSCDNVIKMNSNVDDEISNGPFGDVRESVWGEDFSNSCGLPFAPRGAIVYSGAVNARTGLQSSTNARVTMLRHPTKNFFWCGDSGLIHGGTSSGSETTPFWIGSRMFNGIDYPKYPVDKPGYGRQSANLSVCNSTLFANVMAWAIRMADDNGINSGKD